MRTKGCDHRLDCDHQLPAPIREPWSTRELWSPTTSTNSRALITARAVITYNQAAILLSLKSVHNEQSRTNGTDRKWWTRSFAIICVNLPLPLALSIISSFVCVTIKGQILLMVKKQIGIAINLSGSWQKEMNVEKVDILIFKRFKKTRMFSYQPPP